MTEFLAALCGALVGGVMVFLAELWGQVLTGKAAARLIGVEAHANALTCDWASTGRYYPGLSDSEWRTHSLHVVSLLTEDVVKNIAATYVALHAIQEEIEDIGLHPDDYANEDNEQKRDFRERASDFRNAGFWMHLIEMKSRFQLLVEQLTGRPRFPSEKDINRARKEMLAQSQVDHAEPG